jgi:polar amino acid transport system substrate-binding protein
MNHTRASFVCAVLTLFLAITCTAASTEKIVKVNTIVDYHPFCFKKENAPEQPNEIIPPGGDSSQIQGYSWDVVRASLHEMGYTIYLTIAPASRCLQNAEQGLTDVIFPASKNKERQKTFFFSREPVNAAKYVVYVPADANFAWNGLKSLEGHKIATLRRWTYGDAWEANKKIVRVETESITQSFDILDRKRVFGVVGYEIAYDYFLKEKGIANMYKKLPSFDTNFEFLIGGKNFPQVKKILDDFDEGKKRIVKNGVFGKIERRWK